ncbi:helix-turn-helix domain-containing protein [Jiella pelagia]|uniref:Helix-turn-helix domain-containing protein n=1 Tax=Jiella pelagia TaxID=2986949 RepID=A0ABY7C5J0_9HYPH|nr:helix-turn-helix domain-containing protein [Jiella pelagia]WAP71021.1 helix-turn-helix domain-containing protein [Jiella pelagia]
MNERLSPSFLFDAQEMAGADRFEAYRGLYASGSDVSLAGADFRARVEVQKLGRLVMFERHLNDVTHERTPRRVRADGFEHFTLQLNLSGRLLADLPEGPLEVGPGEIVVFDMTRPQRTRASGAHFLTFSVARDVMEAASLSAFTLHGTLLTGGQAGILADLMRSFVRHRVAEQPDSAGAATRMFREALAMALGAAEASSSPGGDSLARVRLLIEHHLAASELSPVWIARKAGLSRTRLYELFKPIGGIAAYVQARRTARLRALLGRPENGMRSVAQLAFQAGFAAESHAIRLYKRRFGETPGHHRRQLQDLQHPLPAAASGFHGWIDDINR